MTCRKASSRKNLLKGKDSARSAHGHCINARQRVRQYWRRRRTAGRSLLTRCITMFKSSVFTEYLRWPKDNRRQTIRNLFDARHSAIKRSCAYVAVRFRFAGKLGFWIEAKTAATVKRWQHATRPYCRQRAFSRVLNSMGSGNGSKPFFTSANMV